ncbi:MAG: GtrA family protein [Verrucomicrobiaceae bacterium]|nr:GtrA family protein [Verrucomicrobiaceae bacterium]
MRPSDFFLITDKRFLNFVLFGGLNTLTTYALYLLLSCVMHYQLAYLIAYLVGIIIAYLLNLNLVFNSSSSLRKVLLYPFIYLIQYFLGAGLMYLMITIFYLSHTVAPLITIALLLPVSFFLNKRILVNL